MKAKVRQPELAQYGEYLCLKCDNRFRFDGGKLFCPRCKNQKRLDMLPVYVENDKEEEQLYTDGDFGEGD